MELYKQINIDLYNPYPLCIMKAKQGDTARGALITLTGNGEILVPTTESIQIYATKPDGTKIYNTCTIVGNQIQVKFTDQMLALPGHLPVEIEMIDGQYILSTPIFLINVLPTNIDANAIESTNEFTALQTAIAEATAYKAEYLKKPDAVLDSTQASTDSNTGHLEFHGKPFYPEIPVKQIQNFSYGTVDFETAAEREEISTGETLSSLFGKAKKWFSDLASGATSTLLGKNLEINRALIADSSGKVAASDVSSTELGYLKGAKKNIQEQIGTISDLNTKEKGSIVGAINELNSKLVSGYISAQYSSASMLRGYVMLGGKIKSAVATIGSWPGTPTSNVNRIIVEPNYSNTDGRLEIYAEGTGFVSGHNLRVYYIAVIGD